MDRDDSCWKSVVDEESFPKSPRSPELDVGIGSGELRKLDVLSGLLLSASVAAAVCFNCCCCSLRWLLLAEEDGLEVA